jgi:hypothetical protein
VLAMKLTCWISYKVPHQLFAPLPDCPPHPWTQHVIMRGRPIKANLPGCNCQYNRDPSVRRARLLVQKTRQAFGIDSFRRNHRDTGPQRARQADSGQQRILGTADGWGSRGGSVTHSTAERPAAPIARSNRVTD